MEVWWYPWLPQVIITVEPLNVIWDNVITNIKEHVGMAPEHYQIRSRWQYIKPRAFVEPLET